MSSLCNDCLTGGEVRGGGRWGRGESDLGIDTLNVSRSLMEVLSEIQLTKLELKHLTCCELLLHLRVYFLCHKNVREICLEVRTLSAGVE